MNNILQLKGQLYFKKNSNGMPHYSIPAGGVITGAHIESLCSQLKRILSFWEKNTTIKGAIISAYYYHVVAKSNRIKGLFCTGSMDPNETIRGSSFFGNNPIQHVFTHYV